MHAWEATWTPDGDSSEERSVGFEADYDQLCDADVVSRAYRAARRENVVDRYALRKYWRLVDLVGTYAAIDDTLGEASYPRLSAWLDERAAVVAVRPRTPAVDVLLDSKAAGRRLESALRDRLGANVVATVDRTRTRKPGAKGEVGHVPRLKLRTQFRLDDAVERYASD